uniref:Uncharacterized protein n=1 Tax=Romanomermis culicivorax TaxID=13658 RepID=A0A915IJY8_ROMCU
MTTMETTVADFEQQKYQIFIVKSSPLWFEQSATTFEGEEKVENNVRLGFSLCGSQSAGVFVRAIFWESEKTDDPGKGMVGERAHNERLSPQAQTAYHVATITIQNAFLPVGQLADAYPGVDNDQAASGMSGTTIVIIVVVCLLLFLIVAVALFIWWYFFCERKSKEEKKLEELAEKIPKEEEATLKSQITEMEETATEKELKTVPGVSNKETSRNGGNGEGGHRRSTEDGDDGRSSALAVNANYNFVFDSTTSSTVTSSKTSATTSSDKEKKKRKRKRSSDSIEDTSLYRQLLAQIVSIISSMEKPKSRRNKGQK